MFKKFNYNLNHSRVGMIWGLSLVVLLLIGFVYIMPGEMIMPKNEFVTMMLTIGLMMNFLSSTVILFKGDIQPVNVTYVCPTARKYMTEQEIKEVEKGE